MKKVKTFAAKLAHATEGKVKKTCPICNTEIKVIKLIRNRHNDGRWAPKRELVKICKCNEKEILA
ncbi:MAG: hypothetical protein KAW87_00275 [Candidatus Cloacimonetes bacterium]|nr:hypothetical protein [Candidatus Cloacimonadota bacterium]